jgi:membrane associated rhomboid family serine protease
VNGEVAVGRAAARRRAEECLVVLAAAGLEGRIEHEADAWVVLVPDEQQGAAAAALRAYEADLERGDPDTEPPRSWAGVVVAAGLTGVYALAGERAAWSDAFRAGAAVAERIVAGEWWRAVTALTLHADAAHLLGNVASAALFVTAVCGALGPGLGSALVLATGVGGNLAAALVRRTASSSVGASTAIFGAVGILCGRAVIRAARRRTAGRRPWVPLAAGLALLAFLGTSERADLLAHLTGFVVGLPLGAMTAGTPRPGPAAQAALGVASALLVAVSWMLALR